MRRKHAIPAAHRKPTTRSRVIAAALLAVYLSIASVIAVVTAHAFHAHSYQALGPQGVTVATTGHVTPKYLVFMVLDGARPDYFDVGNLPNLDALRANGTQFNNAIDGILEAETPSGHTALATGSRPTQNGVLGFDWATDTGRYSLFDPNKMGDFLRIVQDNHAPTLAGLYKQKFPQAKVVALSGHKYYAAAPLGGPSADAIMYFEGNSKNQFVPVAVPGHVPPPAVFKSPGLTYPTTKIPDGAEDHLATNLALAAVKNMRPRMLLINYPEFDWPLGHIYGGIQSPGKVATDMEGFDADLGRIESAYQRAGILNQTLFVITADHGMMPITSFVPASLINGAVAKAGATQADTASSTADYIWLTEPVKARAVANNIAALNNGDIQSTYYLTWPNGQPTYALAGSTTLPPQLAAANQYLLGALLNGHQPSVVVFGREGVSFTDPKTGWKADHGGSSWQSQHIPLLLAGAGIKPGVITNTPVQMDDIAPTVLTAMGVTPTGMQGHLLTEALQHKAPKTLVAARRAEAKMLQPVVQALLGQEPTTVTGQLAGGH